MKWEIRFVYLSIIALLCDAFFSYLFKISVWRQVLTISCDCIILYHAAKDFNRSDKRIFALIIFLFSYFIWRCLLTYGSLGFSPMRLIYYVWMIFWPLPFYFLPQLVHKYTGSFISLFKFLAFTGGVFGLGLTVDGLSGGFFTKLYVIPIGYASGEISLDDALDRYSFLAIHLTTSGVFLSLSLVAALYLHFYKNSYVYLASCILMIVGSFYTGSRQITLPICLTFIIGYFVGLKGSSLSAIKKFFIAIFTVFIFCFGVNTTINSMSDTAADRYSVNTMQKDNRSRHWKRGFEETVLVPEVFLWGKGVSYSSGIKANKSEITGSHYENSYYSAISCCGIASLFLIIFPGVYIVYRAMRSLKKQRFFCILSLLFAFDYFLIAYISPNALHLATVSAMIMAGCFRVDSYEKRLG